MRSRVTLYSKDDEKTRIVILLPTYNGATYLEQQLDSLLAQSHENFVVVARDDGSTDSSVDLMQRYAEKFPEHFHVLSSDGANLGACGNFSFLMQYVLANKPLLGLDNAYMMFCDQDDVWKPDKIEKNICAMQKQENLSPNTPVLVHSDLEVVDSDLHPLARSLFKYQRINPRRKSVWRMLILNTVTGCTVMINEALATLASPIPNEAVMHDWWVALVASGMGQVVTIDEALISYRQHDTNTVGALQYEPLKISARVKKLMSDSSYKDISLQLYRQASEFSNIYRDQLGICSRTRLFMLRSLGNRSAKLRTLALKVLVVF
jgi:hypothetical protein